MTIDIVLWILLGMVLWALSVIGIILFMMGAHIDEDDEDEIRKRLNRRKRH